jgi:aryl-alcohol dehydrogenase-like predicted oxidoreductase
MHYRRLGKTGLIVSELGLGCASYWGKTIFSEADAVRLVHAAVDRGVTFFDTGASYSGGNAEPRLGRALAALSNRHDLVVATKAGSYTDTRNKRREDYSPQGIRRTVEASLERLGLDAIPLLHLHGPEIPQLTPDLLETLQRLIEEGKVRHLSVNSHDTSVIEHVATLPQFGAVMINYSVFRPEQEGIIRRLAEANIGVLAAASLGGGFFRPGSFAVRGLQDLWYIARAAKSFRSEIWRGRKFDRPINPDEALAWVLTNKDVSSAVFGTTRMDHLISNLGASGSNLDADTSRMIQRAQSAFGWKQ